MTRRKRLYGLLAAGLLVIGFALAYVEFHFHLPEGTGPAGPAVSAEPFEQPWTERKVLLLGVGDSVTAGFGVEEPYSYFGRLVANPKDEFSDMRGRCLSRVLPNLTTRNMAVSGSDSPQHVTWLREKLKTQPDDVFGLIVMTTGGNDLIHWYGRSPPREGAMYGATLQQAQPWIDNFEKRLTEMFTLLEEKFPGGCLVFIADIYDPSDGRGDPETVWMPSWRDCSKIHAAYNATIRRAAAGHNFVRVVPMHAEFLGHGIHCRKFWQPHFRSGDAHYWYAENLEDPNARGYDAVRRVFLNEILKERQAGTIAPQANTD